LPDCEEHLRKDPTYRQMLEIWNTGLESLYRLGDDLAMPGYVSWMERSALKRSDRYLLYGLIRVLFGGIFAAASGGLLMAALEWGKTVAVVTLTAGFVVALSMVICLIEGMDHLFAYFALRKAIYSGKDPEMADWLRKKQIRRAVCWGLESRNLAFDGRNLSFTAKGAARVKALNASAEIEED
jgi:hypothetical protein